MSSIASNTPARQAAPDEAGAPLAACNTPIFTGAGRALKASAGAAIDAAPADKAADCFRKRRRAGKRLRELGLRGGITSAPTHKFRSNPGAIGARLCRRARRVPNPACARLRAWRRLRQGCNNHHALKFSRFETCVSEH
jgi:hypothetical protein